MLTTWVRPWPDEALVGRVVAVSGDRYECVALDGTRFFVPQSETWAEGVVFKATESEVRQMLAMERRVKNIIPVKPTKWSSN